MSRDRSDTRLTSRTPFVRSVLGGKWHIAAHVPTGYGVHALCGVGWPESNYMTKRTEPSIRVVCKTCGKVAAREALSA